MDNKRNRDVDDEATSASGKRARLDRVAGLTSSNAMQAVAHEALAITSPKAAAADSPAATSADVPKRRDSAGILRSGSNSRPLEAASYNNSSNSNFGTSSQSPLVSMSDVTRQFKNAVLKGWDRRSPTYSQVDVLLVYWEDDEDEVKNSVTRLESAFRSSYHFPTEMYAIRSATAHKEFHAKVEEFFSRDRSLDRLAILYYAGQCLASSGDGQPPVLAPRHQHSDVSIPFAPMQTAYESVSCDVLLLLDYSEVVPSPTLAHVVGRRNVVEIIVSPTPDPEQGLVSFTKALADELSASVTDEPLRVEDLHKQVSHHMSASKPRGRGRPPKEPSAKSLVDQKHLPKHHILFHRRSIVVLPLPNEPQVVICLRVLRGSVDVNQWGKWIYSATPRARNTVHIEGLYSGFSTMIVLRVPVAEWDFFPECPAGSFVGYTTIGHIDPRLLEKIDNDLSAKLWLETASPRLSAHLPRAPAPIPPGSRSTPTANTAFVNSSTGAAIYTSASPGYGPDSIDQPSGLGDGTEKTSAGQKKLRKALPTERKLLPSGSSSSSGVARVNSYVLSPLKQHLQQQGLSAQMMSRLAAEREDSERNALLEAAAQKPFKISIKLASQLHNCTECTAGFKDLDSLQNHIRKQHTRPFHCVFNWAGCESTFASKNEWKRHVMSQHILLYYWVCQVEMCSKIVNKAPGVAHSGFSMPNGAIFNRKDLFTQHLRRMHTPPYVKKLLKQVKAATKPPSHPAINDWESRLKELQEAGVRPRCRLPEYMLCPVENCGVEFHGGNAWDERMEHVARHLEAASAGRENPVIFGGKSDPTLTDWSTRPEVGIAKRVGPNTWHLDNPLRPEIKEWTGVDGQEETETEEERPTPGYYEQSYRQEDRQQGRKNRQEQNQQSEQRYDTEETEDRETPSNFASSRERSRSVIEVADDEYHPPRARAGGAQATLTSELAAEKAALDNTEDFQSFEDHNNSVDGSHLTGKEDETTAVADGPRLGEEQLSPRETAARALLSANILGRHMF